MIGSRLGIITSNNTESLNKNVDIFSTVNLFGYTGRIFNIRSSAGGSNDIYYDGTNYRLSSDNSLYSSWIGANIGYITKWYNQGINRNNDAFQNTQSSQPVFDYVNKQVNFVNGQYRFFNTNKTINRSAHSVVVRHGSTIVSFDAAACLVSSGPYSGIDLGMGLFIHLLNPDLDYNYVWWGNASNMTQGGTLADGNLVIGTYNSSLLEKKLYVNKILKTITSNVTACTVVGENALIGRASNQNLNGYLYSVLIYDYSLSQTDINNLPPL